MLKLVRGNTTFCLVHIMSQDLKFPTWWWGGGGGGGGGGIQMTGALMEIHMYDYLNFNMRQFG